MSRAAVRTAPRHRAPQPLRAEVLEAPGSVRLWLHDRLWFEVDEPPADLVSWLRRGAATGLGAPDGIDAPGLRRLMDHIGMLDRAPTDGLRKATIAIVGSGGLARRCAVALGRAGVGQLMVHDPGSTSAGMWGRSHELTRGEALASWLGSRGPQLSGRVRAVPHLDELVGQAALVLVASQSIEPDRVRMAELVRLGLPHLVLRAHRDVGRLGPLVRPGVDPCVGCLDLALGEVDPGRSVALAQLSGRRANPDELVASELVARAMREVSRHVAGRATSLSSNIVVIDAARDADDRIELVAHPQCQCRLVSRGA